MVAGPEIRGAMVKDFLALLHEGKIPRSKEILALVTPSYIALAEQCSRLEWLDAVPVVQLADAARGIVGAELWRETHRKNAADLVERPLFRAFFRGMQNVFGMTPATHARVFPTVLAQAHRNYGPIECDLPGGENAVIRFARCPPLGLTRGMLEVFAGTLEGILALTARDPTVTVEYTAGAGSASLRLKWAK